MVKISAGSNLFEESNYTNFENLGDQHGFYDPSPHISKIQREAGY